MECIRLMFSVGRALSVLPVETAMKYMDTLLSPLVIQLQTLVEQPVSVLFFGYMFDHFTVELQV